MRDYLAANTRPKTYLAVLVVVWPLPVYLTFISAFIAQLTGGITAFGASRCFLRRASRLSRSRFACAGAR